MPPRLRRILQAYYPANEVSAFRGEIGVWGEKDGEVSEIVPLSWIGIPRAIERGFRPFLNRTLVSDYLKRCEENGWDKPIEPSTQPFQESTAPTRRKPGQRLNMTRAQILAKK